MIARTRRPTLSLPKSWPRRVRSAVLHVISLAQFSLAHARGRAAVSRDARTRHRAQIDRLREEVSRLREEIRIKDARMERVPALRRPHYPPTERMAILELRTARGWTLAETAARFLVTPATIASWNVRLEEEGPDALVQIREPVNKFPDFVRHLVRRLKVLCPALGYAKIAEFLARAGFHLGSTTVRRMLRERPRPFAPKPRPESGRTVSATRPNHVLHVDLTTVPIARGFFASWFPFAMPQRWPHCWWVAVALDHYSRRTMGVAVFEKPPSSLEVRQFLGRMIGSASGVPKYVITDKGKQFRCDGFRRWCERKGILPRFGAVGKYGSLAVIERFIRTMKDECTRRIVVDYRRDAFKKELSLFLTWYNEYRPNAVLEGRTPDEVYRNLAPRCDAPRFEPRARWPRESLCASPQARVRGRCGARLELRVRYLEGRKHLPIVSLRRVA